jgi:hypothetical protein
MSGLSQAEQAATFHIDHITPVVAGGATTADNLALACVSCLLGKATDKRLKIGKRVKQSQFLILAKIGKNISGGMGSRHKK